ncbi:DUF1003 domain-containing protein [Aureimonas sp. SA4125]|uniref:DUF1003 domain-containing protein n=1 Tax=Aureimonas sp. SA4125 TaxID=2826993 RepID=UPI001CC45C15|nr:DUF1003 domain-containing protein [Aureimonas sp. SA4125]
MLHWLGRSHDTLKPSERRVLNSALSGEILARDVNAAISAETSLGDRLADAIARVGGSWGFIIAFFAFLFLWVTANTIILVGGAFDPYPFIFLNLVLSMIAAVQAPIIMMSQNRAAARDRLDASHDYEINLKAEIEILALHEKLDAMRHEDTRRLEDLLLRMGERLEVVESRLPDRRQASTLGGA